MSEAHQVEATGETVGEAKWQALRELERVAPGLDKAAVRFEVVSEGERGLLGVGYAPARVIASVDANAVSAPAPVADGDESALAADLRELLTRLPDIAPAGPAEWLASNFISGPKHLPVQYTPARHATA